MPAWLVASADKSRIDLIPERAEIVRLIFKPTSQGWGKDRIAKKLNDEKVEPWGMGKQKGKYWHDTYVAKILANRAVIGEMQWHSARMDPVTGLKIKKEVGDPIPNYFPAVVPLTVWNKVQSIRQTRAKRPGRIGNHVRNLFTGLLHCGRTGYTVAFSNKDPHFYLRSTSLKKIKPWPYQDFEDAFFNFVGQLKVDCLPPKDDSANQQVVFMANLRSRIERLSKQIFKLIDLATNDKEERLPAEISEKLKTYEEERKELRKQLAGLEETEKKTSLRQSIQQKPSMAFSRSRSSGIFPITDSAFGMKSANWWTGFFFTSTLLPQILTLASWNWSRLPWVQLILIIRQPPRRRKKSKI